MHVVLYFDSIDIRNVLVNIKGISLYLHDKYSKDTNIQTLSCILQYQSFSNVENVTAT